MKKNEQIYCASFLALLLLFIIPIKSTYAVFSDEVSVTAGAKFTLGSLQTKVVPVGVELEDGDLFNGAIKNIGTVSGHLAYKVEAIKADGSVTPIDPRNIQITGASVSPTDAPVNGFRYLRKNNAPLLIKAGQTSEPITIKYTGNITEDMHFRITFRLLQTNSTLSTLMFYDDEIIDIYIRKPYSNSSDLLEKRTERVSTGLFSRLQEEGVVKYQLQKAPIYFGVDKNGTEILSLNNMEFQFEYYRRFRELQWFLIIPVWGEWVENIEIPKEDITMSVNSPFKITTTSTNSINKIKGTVTLTGNLNNLPSFLTYTHNFNDVLEEERSAITSINNLDLRQLVLSTDIQTNGNILLNGTSEKLINFAYKKGNSAPVLINDDTFSPRSLAVSVTEGGEDISSDFDIKTNLRTPSLSIQYKGKESRTLDNAAIKIAVTGQNGNKIILERKLVGNVGPAGINKSASSFSQTRERIRLDSEADPSSEEEATEPDEQTLNQSKEEISLGEEAIEIQSETENTEEKNLDSESEEDTKEKVKEATTLSKDSVEITLEFHHVPELQNESIGLREAVWTWLESLKEDSYQKEEHEPIEVEVDLSKMQVDEAIDIVSKWLSAQMGLVVSGDPVKKEGGMWIVSLDKRTDKPVDSADESEHTVEPESKPGPAEDAEQSDESEQETVTDQMDKSEIRFYSISELHAESIGLPQYFWEWIEHTQTADMSLMKYVQHLIEENQLNSEDMSRTLPLKESEEGKLTLELFLNLSKVVQDVTEEEAAEWLSDATEMTVEISEEVSKNEYRVILTPVE